MYPQNLTLELATMGDLKLVERLQQYTLAPGASKVIRANIKVRVAQASKGIGMCCTCSVLNRRGAGASKASTLNVKVGG